MTENEDTPSQKFLSLLRPGELAAAKAAMTPQMEATNQAARPEPANAEMRTEMQQPVKQPVMQSVMQPVLQPVQMKVPINKDPPTMRNTRGRSPGSKALSQSSHAGSAEASSIPAGAAAQKTAILTLESRLDRIEQHLPTCATSTQLDSISEALSRMERLIMGNASSTQIQGFSDILSRMDASMAWLKQQIPEIEQKLKEIQRDHQHSRIDANKIEKRLAESEPKVLNEISLMLEKLQKSQDPNRYEMEAEAAAATAARMSQLEVQCAEALQRETFLNSKCESLRLELEVYRGPRPSNTGFRAQSTPGQKSLLTGTLEKAMLVAERSEFQRNTDSASDQPVSPTPASPTPMSQAMTEPPPPVSNAGVPMSRAALAAPNEFLKKVRSPDLSKNAIKVENTPKLSARSLSSKTFSAMGKQGWDAVDSSLMKGDTSNFLLASTMTLR